MTATVRLYDLASAADILDEFLSETEGEVTPELEQLLDELHGQITEKVERVALYIRSQVATAAAIKEEEERLSRRRKSLERAAEGLKGYLKAQLERLGKDKVQATLCTVALQKNPPSVKVEIPLDVLFDRDPDVVNTRTIPEHVEYTLNREAVLAEWKTGNPLPEGVRVEQGTSLRIR